MNIPRQHLAVFLNDAARTGLKNLDKNSQAARELQKLDLEVILKEDIDKICAEVSFVEMVKITSLVAAIKMGGKDIERLKADIKGIAKILMARIEKKNGGLRIPPSCRDLLFDL